MGYKRTLQHLDHTVRLEPGLNMNLLSLLLFVTFAIGIGAIIPEKVAGANDVPQQVAAEDQGQINLEETGDKKVAKRSYGWSPWSYVGHSYGWPWYGHGWYSGWYPGWPLFYGHGYGGYSGYHGSGGHGWYKGW